MRPGVRRSHEGGAVTSTPLGWELDESPHPHVHPVIKDFMKPLSLIPLDPSKFRENGSHPPKNGPYDFHRKPLKPFERPLFGGRGLATSNP